VFELVDLNGLLNELFVVDAAVDADAVETST